MTDEKSENEPTIDLSIASRIDQICDEFEALLKAGKKPQVGEFVERLTTTDENRKRLAVELISLDRHYRLGLGETPEPDDYRLPAEIHDAIEHVFSIDASPNDDPGSAEMATIEPESRAAGDWSIGDRIRYFGDYELLSEIARGGMGVVYKAKQISLNRVIALKMILSGQIAGENEIRRFQLEAESAANLDHPGIVPIYDIGEHNGQHYFSMKLIEGKTLTELSPELRGDHGQIVQLVAQIADAIHHAHQRGILHRDLKPGNVLIDGDGMPMVTDFGLARKMESGEQLTQTGAVVGTPGFMSPEQASGKGVTTSTDIYSLGAILYQLLCGRPPHASETVLDTLMSVISDPPTRPRQCDPEIPSDLELIVLKSLEKDPAKRYSSAAEFAADLRAFTAGEPVSVRAPSPVELVRSWIGKNYGNLVWVPVIAIIVGFISGFSIWVVTLGGDQSIRLPTLRQFSGIARPQLIDWRPWFWPAIGAFVVLLSTLGYATARLVQTKNRAADLGAGLSVGLLTGLIAFVAGLGPLFVEFMTSSSHDDLIVYEAAIGNHETARDLILQIYPDLNASSDRQRIAMITDKIENDENASTLIGMWMGTPMCLLIFGLTGLLQTWVAGPIVRERSTISGLLSYACFGLAVVAGGYILGSNLSMYLMYGSGFIMHPLAPLLCFALIILAVITVLKRWPIPIQILATIGWLIFFVPFVWQMLVTAPAPQIAKNRYRVKSTQRRHLADPTNRDKAYHLAYACNDFGAFLSQIGWHADALAHYEQAAETMVTQRSPDEFTPQENGAYMTALYGAAQAALSEGRATLAVKYFSEHSQWSQPSSRASALFAQAIWKTGQRPEDFVQAGKASEPSSWFKTARQLRRVLQFRENHSNLKNPYVDLSDREMIRRILANVEDVEDPSSWANRKSELAAWLGSRQQWRLYGPHKIRDGSNATEALDEAYGEQGELLTGDSIPEPKATLNQYTGLPVELTDELGDIQGVVGFAVTEFELDKSQKVTFRIGSNDGVKVWIDGETVHRNMAFRDHVEASDLVEVDLKAGRHTMLLKITQGTATWGLILDAAGSDGWPIALWDDIAQE